MDSNELERLRVQIVRMECRLDDAMSLMVALGEELQKLKQLIEAAKEKADSE